MRKEGKDQIIENLVEQIGQYNSLYVTNIADLNAAKTFALRKMCFDKGIKLIVVKNTLLKKALEKSEGAYDELYDVLNQPTAIMLSNESNAPAKLIKEFRKTNDKPILKGAYVQESVYVGDNQLDALANIKSKEELIGDIIAMLQAPANNVISALQSGNHLLAGLVKTLSERE